MSAVLEHRVDRLEEALEAFTRSVGVEFNKDYNGQVRLQQEMLAFKEEMLAFKDEMKDFKDEMKDLKDDSLRCREESERDRKSMNRQWGELANRLGTLVEDIVAPNLPRVARDLLGCPQPDLFGVRMRRRFNGDGCPKPVGA